jgi:hypothetical protein
MVPEFLSIVLVMKSVRISWESVKLHYDVDFTKLEIAWYVEHTPGLKS